MIKPQSQPSYFELKAEGREWSNKGHIPSCSHHPFNSNLKAPEIPALPVDNPVPPALTSKATPSAPGQLNLPSQVMIHWKFHPLQDDPANQIKEFHQ